MGRRKEKSKMVNDSEVLIVPVRVELYDGDTFDTLIAVASEEYWYANQGIDFMTQEEQMYILCGHVDDEIFFYTTNEEFPMMLKKETAVKDFYITKVYNEQIVEQIKERVKI